MKNLYRTCEHSTLYTALWDSQTITGLAAVEFNQ